MAGGERLDTEGMWDLVGSLPEQVEEAADQARWLDGLPKAEDVENVVCLGMGGSAMVGEILAAVAAPQLPVPITVIKSYECPAFVSDTTLVFACSASGDTEETIQAASDAAVAGGRMVVITSGGELARLADGWGAPLLEIPPVDEPRTAVGAMAIPALVALEEVGLFRGAGFWIEAAVEQLKRRRDELLAAGDAGPAARVARRIGRTIPIISGGGALGAAAAQRWKTQVNENAKAPAFWSSQPELCHNEVCGWGQHGDVTRQIMTSVALRHDAEHPQVGRRFELVAELMREVMADVIEVRAEGDGDLAQLFDLILLGDYVSLWMAADAGVDPGPVPVLTEVKSALAI